VRRIAATVLRDDTHRLHPSVVWTIFRAAPNPGAKVSTLRVLGRLPYWERLPYLLKAMRSDLVEVRDLARAMITACFQARNHHYLQPSAALAESVRTELSKGGVSDTWRLEIEEMLRDRTAG